MHFQQLGVALSLVTASSVLVLYNNAATNGVFFNKERDGEVPDIVPYLETAVTSILQCNHRCVKANNCTSFNFKLSENGQHACALLKTNGKMVFVTSPEWSHYSLSHHEKVTQAAFDCLDLYRAGMRTDGVYDIYLSRKTKVKAYCDMQNGGWTVFQRRNQEINLSFKRTWKEYKEGFGDLNKDFWWGNDNLHLLTNKINNQFVFTFRFRGQKSFQKLRYDVFGVDSEEQGYRLAVRNKSFGKYNPFSYHDRMQFATMDRDNADCSNKYGEGGWWFNSCFWVNPNGEFNTSDKLQDVFLQPKNKLSAVSLKTRRFI